MFKIEITECCLRDGFNSHHVKVVDTFEDAQCYIEEMLQDLNIDPAKFYSRHRSVAKGTMKGIKLFWSPKPGTRHYLFINVYDWVSFAGNKPLLEVDKDAGVSRTLTPAQIAKLYNVYDFEDDEEIIEAYIDTKGQLYIKYQDADGLITDYIPRVSEPEDKKKLEEILNG